MKISEKQLRSLIRRQILNEYRSAASDYTAMRWKTCNLDFPDKFIRKQGSRSVRQAEKLASTAAKLYGIPGEFCNLFNAIFGDNPEEFEDIKKKSPGREQILASMYFTTLNADLVEARTAFIKKIHTEQDNDADTKIAAIRSDARDYDGIITKVEALHGIQPNDAAQQLINLVVSETSLSNNSSYLKEAKQKIKEREGDNINDQAITGELIQEMKIIIKKTANANANDSELREKYDDDSTVEAEYDEFLNKLSGL